MVDQRSDAKPNPCDGEAPVRAAASSEAGKPASRRSGSLALDPDARILYLDDRPLPLGERAISILLMLVERSGQVVSKEELVSATWPGVAVEDSSLTDQIAALRRVLALVPGGNSWIETLPRRGYRFAGPIMGPAETARTGSSEATGGDADAPIPFMSIDARSRRIVGREAPLEMLDRITQHMLTGQRQIAFVTGEPGIGKTAFVDMAMERLSQQGVDLLCGRCTERFGTDEAFLPLIDALASRCRAPDAAELLVAIRTHAPTWLLHIPGFIDKTDRTAFQQDVFGATRERMLREFCNLLEALSAIRPWVLVLEDLHWSDFATVDVLSRFA